MVRHRYTRTVLRAVDDFAELWIAEDDTILLDRGCGDCELKIQFGKLYYEASPTRWFLWDDNIEERDELKQANLIRVIKELRALRQFDNELEKVLNG